MAPAEIMHCRPLWMSPSGQYLGPVALTWSDTKKPKHHKPVTTVLKCHMDTTKLFLARTESKIFSREQKFTWFCTLCKIKTTHLRKLFPVGSVYCMTVKLHDSIRKFHHQLRARCNVKQLMSNIKKRDMCLYVQTYIYTTSHSHSTCTQRSCIDLIMDKTVHITRLIIIITVIYTGVTFHRYDHTCIYISVKSNQLTL